MKQFLLGARLAVASLKTRTLQTILSVLLITICITVAVFIVHVKHHYESTLSFNKTPVDIVVGAKGSKLQLVLSSLYHADIPTGNIPESVYHQLAKNPQIRQAIPLALGDNFKGYRIVGTTPDFISLYQARIQYGSIWDKPMQLVIGATVAQQQNLSVGSRIIGAHGLISGGDANHHNHHDHDSTPYIVTGILAPTGTIIDRLILTSHQSVQDIHEDPHHHHHDDEDRDITAILIDVRSSSSILSLPRQIDRDIVAQAAVPSYEMARLSQIMGIGIHSLRSVSIILLALAGFSIFVGLSSSFETRMHDLALIRALGGERVFIASIILWEGFLICLLSVMAGLLLGHTVFHILAHSILSFKDTGASGLHWLPAEYGIIAVVFIALFIAAFIPAIRTYRLDPASVLDHNR